MVKRIIPLTLVTVICLGLVHLYLLDGMMGAVADALLEDTTVYSTGYSESAFKRVSKGITAQQVQDLIGKDMCQLDIVDSKRPGCGRNTLPDGTQVLRYSGTPVDGNYRVRVLHIKNDRVIGKLAGYYVD